MNKIRVRFAPSPTGPLHLGSIRTALYNYLFAKKNNGDFILRIEDTDNNRIIPEAETYIKKSLSWCKIIPDESPYSEKGEYGPYRQSERIKIYKKYIKYLLDSGDAYYAFDTQEFIDNEKIISKKNGEVFSYNYKNRCLLNNSLNISKKKLKNNLLNGMKYVIRFKVPKNVIIKINDIVKGNIFISSNILDDKILFKSNGFPTYHFANVIDDHLMMISHVIRGEEWLSSLPLHLLLYKSFKWKTPYFAHLPLILNPSGKGKLSKRNIEKSEFPIFPLQWIDPKSKIIIKGYYELGYLSDAFINMIALLGWNPGDEKEIFSMEKLISSFSLENINKSSSRFNQKKAKWFNKKHLQKIPTEYIYNFVYKKLETHKIHLKLDVKIFKKIILLSLNRSNLFIEIWQNIKFFFIRPNKYDEKPIKKIKNIKIINCLLTDITNIFNKNNYYFFYINIKNDIEKILKINDIQKKTIQYLRLSIVGKICGPDLYFIMEIIGKKECIIRIKNFISYIKKR